MSAPSTNVETQKRRHAVALNGMALVVGFASVLLVAFVAYLAINGNTPEDTGPQVAVTPGLGAELEAQ